MSIDIELLSKEDRDEWNEYVRISDRATVFHQYAALEAQATHAGGTLYPFVGYKGQEAFGLFPVFEIQKGPVTMAYSPPYELHVPNLGPLRVTDNGLKQRKLEKQHKGFVDGCIERIEREINPNYFSIRTAWEVDDVRPFTWNEFTAQPGYTYVVDTETTEERLLNRFSSTPRSHIRNNRDRVYTVTADGGESVIDWVSDRIVERYEEQGKTPTTPTAFIHDLCRRLPDEQVHLYRLCVDGETVAGAIILQFGRTAHRWQAGATFDVDLPAGDLLEWHIMCDAIESDVTTYELVDANTHRINMWKAKFNPDIRTYYTMHRSDTWARYAANVYTRLRDRTPLRKYKSKFNPEL